jgi:GNAT superfamily N-acetyltransferase
MQFQRFAPMSDTGLARACHAMYVAGAPADDPDGPVMSERSFTAWLALGWMEERPEAWLARDEAGHPCGWYSAGFPQRENRHRGYLSVLVSPERRRRGIGTRLLAHAAARAREEGRAALSWEAREGSAAEAFVRDRGGRPGLTEVRRVQRITVASAGHLAELRAQAQPAAAGYSLEHWQSMIPEDQLAAVAAVNEAMGDAPRDDDEESMRWDADRVREDLARVAAAGHRLYTVAVRHDGSGEMAGLTQVAIDPADPGWAYQELTAVARQHRGHRLGLLLKLAMLAWLGRAEPQLHTILTGNADANEHMIAINEALGYEVLDRWRSWQLGVARLAAAPAAASGNTQS